MTTISHEPSGVVEERRWLLQLFVHEMWAALASFHCNVNGPIEAGLLWSTPWGRSSGAAGAA